MKAKLAKALLIGSLMSLGLVSQATATIYTIQFGGTADGGTAGNANANKIDIQTGGTAPGTMINDADGIWAILTFDSNTNAFSITTPNTPLTDFFNQTNVRINGIAFDFPTNPTGTNITGMVTNPTNVTGNTNGGNAPAATSIVKTTTSGTSSGNLGGTGTNDLDVGYIFGSTADMFQNETLGFTIGGFNPNCLTASTGSNCAQNSNLLSASAFSLNVFGLTSSGSRERESWFRGTSIKADNGIFAATAMAVPEPQSYGMFLAGLGLLGFVSRRRRN